MMKSHRSFFVQKIWLYEEDISKLQIVEIEDDNANKYMYILDK